MIGLMVVPPLVAQSVALWDRLPDELNRFQGFLIRYRILRGPLMIGAILAIPTVAILSIIVDQIAAARDTMRLEA